VRSQTTSKLGPYDLNSVVLGDCLRLIPDLPPASIDIVVTSPPYWGQRLSDGIGVEQDPRTYLDGLAHVFVSILPKLKPRATVWINLGDAYNTPVNWSTEHWDYSTLGPKKTGFGPTNSAYIKPRAKRRAYIDANSPWLAYGNLLALPYRLILSLCDKGYFFRGEVIWKKKNPMPEGLCRRPHRQHEAIYLLAKSERDHAFRRKPPVGTVWEFANDQMDGKAHFSRFPEELPRRCIEAYGLRGPEVVVLDPFSGSGTTGIVAAKLGCAFLGFEIDERHVRASNERMRSITSEYLPLFGSAARPQL